MGTLKTGAGYLLAGLRWLLPAVASRLAIARDDERAVGRGLCGRITTEMCGWRSQSARANCYTAV